MYEEIRVYTVKAGAMEAWVTEWREHIVPLRLRLGFSIPAAWVVEGDDRFVWILRYEGDDYELANDAYYQSPERLALAPEPTRHLEHTEHWPLRRIA